MPEEKEHPKRKGIKTEAIIRAEFVRHGATVLEPFGDNERYDFVVESDGKFHRIQCKTGRKKSGCVVFETRSTGVLTYENVRETYDGDIDYFAVYSYETGDAYLIPIEETGSSSMRLRVDEPGIHSPNINWADEYRLDENSECF